MRIFEATNGGAPAFGMDRDGWQSLLKELKAEGNRIRLLEKMENHGSTDVRSPLFPANMKTGNAEEQNDVSLG